MEVVMRTYKYMGRTYNYVCVSARTKYVRMYACMHSHALLCARSHARAH